MLTTCSIKTRVSALMSELLKSSRINQAFVPVIARMADSLLKNVSDQELREGIIKVRDEMIPFLLEENEDTYQQ